LDAHRSYQRLRRGNQLQQARAALNRCSRRECPGAVVTDCATWLSELLPAIPSVVFDVTLDGAGAPAARVIVDGVSFDAWADGGALELDPGKHSVRFELAPFPPKEDVFVLSEGMKFRAIAAEFRSSPASDGVPSAPATVPSVGPRPAPPSLAPEPSVKGRPVPGAVYPLMGVGAAGLAVFIGAGVAGKAEQNRLDRECVPACEERALNKMLAFYTTADVALAVSVSALVGAGVVYATRPGSKPHVAVALTPLPAGAGATLSVTRF
jgi:hypothetical protein